MIALDYNSLVNHQHVGVDKSRRKIKFLFGFSLTHFLRFLITKSITKVNTRLTNHLIFLKGILSDLRQKEIGLDSRDLTSTISSINKQLKYNISFREDIRDLLKADKDENFEGLLTTLGLIEEVIEIQYDTMRILKRHNIRKKIETSSLAFESNARSLTSLESALNDHRTA